MSSWNVRSFVGTSDENAHAVEVVAMFGDAIVGVRHVAQPRGGKQFTRALLVGGFALLGVAAVAFAIAMHHASLDAAARAAWIAAKKPAWAFRGELGSSLQDVLAFGSSFLGVAAIVMALQRRSKERAPTSVRIGSDANADFAAGAVDADLVTPNATGDGFDIHLAGMSGEIVEGKQSRSFTATDGLSIPATDGVTVHAKVGLADFHIRRTAPPREMIAARGMQFDRRIVSFIVASACVHLGIWYAGQLGSANASSIDVNIADSNDLETRSVWVEKQLEAPHQEQSSDSSDDKGASAPDHVALALAEGATGAPTPSPDPGRREIAQHSDQPALARKEADDVARESGILASMHSPDMFQAMTGQADMSSGFSDADIYGAVDGRGTGGPQGFGTGNGGTGPGGGGQDWNGFRAGGFATIGTGGRAGDGVGFPGGHGHHDPHRDSAIPPVKMLKPTIIGEIDMSIVRRHIHNNLDKIRNCYELQLIAKPELAGEVMADFTFTNQGAVISSTASGVDPQVSSCIAQVIKNIEFPHIDVAGVYKIRYPFEFRSTSQAK